MENLAEIENTEDEVPPEIVERIAKLIVQEVPVDQIAYVLGVSTADAVKICEHEIVLAKVSEIAAARMSQVHEMNDGWDSVEQKALQVVQSNLAFNKDPEFALKAARVANQAQRRSRMGAANAVPSVVGAKAVISLNMQFVKQVQSTDDSEERKARTVDIANLPRRDQDFLPPDKLEKVLAVDTEGDIDKDLAVIEAQFDAVEA